MRPAALVLLIALSGACAGTSACPAQGGPIWRELRTEHFVLSTDLRPEQARETATTLETLQAAVLEGVFPGAPTRPRGRLAVIVVAHQNWEEYSDRFAGVFARPLGRPLIAMRASHPIEEDLLIKHELVHYLSEFYVPRQTRWLAEGVASYFESLSYDLDARTVTFGRPSERPRLLNTVRSLPLAAVLDDDNPGWREHRVGVFMSTSWLMVHYLMNRRPDDFQAYQRHLQRGTPAEAWRQVFGEPEALPDLALALERYAGSGKYLVTTAPFQPPVVTPQVREESDAEVHAHRALLHFTFTLNGEEREGHRQRALEEADEALHQDRANAQALSIRRFLLDGPPPE